MNDLIAIAYPDKATAMQARDTLHRLQSELLIDLDDVVIAVNQGDVIQLDQSISPAGIHALGGAVWGGLLGLIFLVPITGMVAGAASGALAGSFADYGVDDAFVTALTRQLDPGYAALFLLVREAAPDKVLAEMRRYGGTVLRTTLSHDAEQRLRTALSESST